MSSQEPEIRFENLSVGDLTLDNPLDIPPTVVPVREAVPSDYVWTDMAQLPDSAPTGAPFSATAPYPNPPGEENGSTNGPIKQIRVLLTRQTAPDDNILLASTTGGAPFNGADNVVENVIAASLGDGYAPTFEYGGGSEGDPGTLVPHDSATWVVDGLTGRVAFTDPATLDGYEAATTGTTYYYLNYWQYTGIIGGGGGGGAVNSVTSTGVGISLVGGPGSTAADPKIRGLTAGTNITIVPPAPGAGDGALTIDTTGVVTSVTSAAGAGASIVQDGTAPVPDLRTVLGGAGITATAAGADLTVASTLANAGGASATGQLLDVSAPALPVVRGVTLVTNTSDTNGTQINGDNVQIDIDRGVTAVASVAGAPGVVAAPSPVDAANRAGLVSSSGTGPAPLIKTIQGGDGIKVVNSADRVDISVISSGEISEDPLRIYVNAATGDDTAYDGRSATVSAPAGPYATLERALQEVQALGWDTEASIELGGATAIPLDAPLNVGGRGRQETPLVIKGPTVVPGAAVNPANTSTLAGSRLLSFTGAGDTTLGPGDFLVYSGTTLPIFEDGSEVHYLPSNAAQGAQHTGQYAASTLPTISIAADQVLASDAAQVIFEDLRLTADAGEPVIAEGAEIILRRCKLTAQSGGSGNHYLDTRAGGRFRAEASAFIDFDDTNRDFSPPLLAATNSVFSGVSQSIIGELEQCVFSNSFISSRGGSLVQVHGETIAGDLVVLGVVDITDVALNSVTLINGTLTSFTDDVGTDATAVDRLGALYLVSGHMDSIADSTADSVTIESGATAGVLGTLTIAGADAGIVLGGELTLGGLAISGSTVPVNVIDVAGGRLTMLGAIDLDVGDGAAVRGLRLTAGGRATLAGTSGTPDDIDLSGVTTLDQVTDAILVANGCCLFTAEVVSTSIGLNPDLIKVGNLPAGAKADVANRWGLAVCPLKSNAGTSAPADAAPAIYVNPGAAITDPTTAAVVAAAGNDATGDGSRARPFATLTRASETLQALGWDRTAEIRLVGDLTPATKTLDLNAGSLGAQRVPLKLIGWDAVADSEGVQPQLLAANDDLATATLLDLSTGAGTAFSDPAAGFLYLGGLSTFSNISYLVDTVAGNASALGDVADVNLQYWNGAWVNVGFESVSSGELFDTTTGKEVTFSGTGGWVAKNIGGATRFWVRLQVLSDLGTSPQIQVGAVARPGAPVAAQDTDAEAGNIISDATTVDLAFEPATALPGTADGNTLYLAAPDAEAFTRIEYEVTANNTNVLSDYTVEYSQVGGWSAFGAGVVRINSSTVTGPFQNLGQTFLTLTSAPGDWAPATVDGQTRHWLRITAAAGGLSAVPQIQLAKDPTITAGDGGLARVELVGAAPAAGTMLYATSGGAGAAGLQVISAAASGDFATLPYSDVGQLTAQNVETVLVPYDVQHKIVISDVTTVLGSEVQIDRVRLEVTSDAGLVTSGQVGLYGVPVDVQAGVSFGLAQGHWLAGGLRKVPDGTGMKTELETLGVYVECADSAASFGDLTADLGGPENSVAKVDVQFSTFRGTPLIDPANSANYSDVEVAPTGADITDVVNKIVSVKTEAAELTTNATGALADGGTVGQLVRIIVRSLSGNSSAFAFRYRLTGKFVDAQGAAVASRDLLAAGDLLELRWNGTAWADVEVRGWSPQGALRDCYLTGMGTLAADEGALVVRNAAILSPSGRQALAVLGGTGRIDSLQAKLEVGWVAGAYVLGGHLTVQGQAIRGPGGTSTVVGSAHGLYAEGGGELDIVVKDVEDRVHISYVGADGLRAGAGARVTIGDSRLDLSQWGYVSRGMVLTEYCGLNGLHASNGAVVNVQRATDSIFGVECDFERSFANGLLVREGARVTLDAVASSLNAATGITVDAAELWVTHEATSFASINNNTSYNLHILRGGQATFASGMSTSSGSTDGALIDTGTLTVNGFYTAFSNGGNGLRMVNQSRFICSGTTRLHDNAENGMLIDGQSEIKVFDGDIYNNALVGIVVTGSSSATCGALSVGYRSEQDSTSSDLTFTSKIVPNGGAFDPDVFKGGVLVDFGGELQVTGNLECRFNQGTANLRIADGAQVRVAGLLVADGRDVQALVQMERGGRLNVDGDGSDFQYEYTERPSQGEAKIRIPLFNSVSYDNYDPGSGAALARPPVAFSLDTGAEVTFASDYASVGCERSTIINNGAKLICRASMRAMDGEHEDTAGGTGAVDGVVSVDGGAEFRVTNNLDMNGRFIEGRLGGPAGVSHYQTDTEATLFDREGAFTGGAPGADVFHAGAADECFYVGANVRFDEIRYVVNTAAASATAANSDIVLEYNTSPFNSGTWVPISAVVTGGDNSSLFEATAAKTLNFPNFSNWQTIDIGGSSSRFYVRLRIVNALAGTRPALHSLELYVDDDGTPTPVTIEDAYVDSDADPKNGTEKQSYDVPASGGAAPVFPNGTVANEVCFLGFSDQFDSATFEVVDTVTTSTSAEIEVAYWDSSINDWQPIAEGGVNGNYSITGGEFFDATGTKTLTFVGGAAELSNWTTNTVDEVRKYWIRLRTIGGALGGAPTIRQFRPDGSVTPTGLQLRTAPDLDVASATTTPAISLVNTGVGASVFQSIANNSVIYFGDDFPIAQIEYIVETLSTNGSGDYRLQYYGGPSDFEATWHNLTFSVALPNGSSSASEPFEQTGNTRLTYTPSATSGEPRRLTIDGQNKYWLRLYILDAPGISGTPEISNVFVNTAPQIPVNLAVASNSAGGAGGLGVYGGGATRFAVTGNMTSRGATSTNLFLAGCEFSVSAALDAGFAAAGAGLVTINGRCTIGAYLNVSACGAGGLIPAEYGACHVALQGILSVGYLLQADLTGRTGLTIDGESLARIGALRARGAARGLSVTESSFLLVAYGVDCELCSASAESVITVDKSTLNVFGENALSQPIPGGLIPVVYSTISTGVDLLRDTTEDGSSLNYLRVDNTSLPQALSGTTLRTSAGETRLITSSINEVAAAVPLQLCQRDNGDSDGVDAITYITVGDLATNVFSTNTAGDVMLIFAGYQPCNVLNYTGIGSTSTVDLEYFDGSGWTQLAGGIDLSAGLKKIRFEPPAAWVGRRHYGGQTSFHTRFGYWMRLRLITFADTVQFGALTVETEAALKLAADLGGDLTTGSTLQLSGLPEARLRVSNAGTANDANLALQLDSAACAMPSLAVVSSNGGVLVRGGSLNMSGDIYMRNTTTATSDAALACRQALLNVQGLIDVQDSNRAALIVDNAASISAQRMRLMGNGNYAIWARGGSSVTVDATGASDIALMGDGNFAGIYQFSAEIRVIADDGFEAASLRFITGNFGNNVGLWIDSASSFSVRDAQDFASDGYFRTARVSIGGLADAPSGTRLISAMLCRNSSSATGRGYLELENGYTDVSNYSQSLMQVSQVSDVNFSNIEYAGILHQVSDNFRFSASRKSSIVAFGVFAIMSGWEGSIGSYFIAARSDSYISLGPNGESTLATNAVGGGAIVLGGVGQMRRCVLVDRSTVALVRTMNDGNPVTIGSGSQNLIAFTGLSGDLVFDVRNGGKLQMADLDVENGSAVTSAAVISVHNNSECQLAGITGGGININISGQIVNVQGGSTVIARDSTSMTVGAGTSDYVQIEDGAALSSWPNATTAVMRGGVPTAAESIVGITSRYIVDSTVLKFT